jgi:pimeloyl-ACP methyl ester carboxylesterase
LAAQATHLANAAQVLGLRDPVVVGQSYGGAVALAWGLQFILRPKALVLIGAPALPWPGKLGPWYRVTKTWVGRTIAVPLASAFVSDAYLRKTIADIFAPCPVPAQYHEKICAALTLRMKTLGVNLKQVNGLRQELVQMAPYYASLTLPIRLIHGTADTIVPLAIHAAPLIKMLPNAELTVIQNGGHMPHFSHTDLVIDAIVKASSTPILRAAGVAPP